MFYIKTKMANIPFDNQFTLLPVNYLVTGFPAAGNDLLFFYNFIQL